MYSDFYGTESMVAGTAMTGLFFGIILFVFILSLIVIISYWKIFVKAGKPGWATIIPIYNYVVMIDIAKLPMWYIVLFFIPVANIVALFKINIEMAKKFGKSSGFGIGMALVGVIFIPLLAFSDSNYEDVKKEETISNNSFDASTVINNGVENNAVGTQPSPVVAPDIPVEPVVAAPEVPVEPAVAAPEVPVEPVVAAPEISVEPAVAAPEVSVEPVVAAPEIPVEPAVAAPEVSVEPVVAAPEISVEPAVAAPEVPVEPVVAATEANTLNAFNSTPIVEEIPLNNEVTDVLETPVISETDNVVNEINETIVIENLTQNPLRKVCKNCGNELPEIVSICPNCGTDNE